MDILDKITPPWVKAIPYIVIAILLIILAGGGAYGYKLHKDGQTVKAALDAKTAEADKLTEANKGLMEAPEKLAKVERVIDVRYRDRFNTIERVVKEKDLTAANALLQGFTVGFYDAPPAEPAPTSAPVATNEVK